MVGKIANEEGALPAPLPVPCLNDCSDITDPDTIALIQEQNRPYTPPIDPHRVMREIRSGESDPDWPANKLANCDVPDGGWPAEMKATPSAVLRTLTRWRRWERIRANTEEWRPAKIWRKGSMHELCNEARSGLWVSSQGRLVVCDRTGGREFGRRIGVLNANLNRMMVIRRINGKRVWLYRYRIVLSTFVGAPPDEKPSACHADGESTNDALTNLRWDSQKANSEDMVRHGRSTRGTRQPGSKLTEDQVAEIRQAVVERGRPDMRARQKIAQAFGVSLGAINGVIYDQRWKHIEPDVGHRRLDNLMPA